MPNPLPIYKDHEVMRQKLNEYFIECEEKEEVPNIVGMYLYLGFSSRQSLVDYEKKNDHFLHVIKAAKAKCYQVKFQQAIKGNLNVPVFIFDAVNNHDMFNTRSENKNDNKNKHTGDIDLSVNFVEPNGD